MYKNKFLSAIITAAGLGTRMNRDIPKLEIKIKNKAIINYTFEKIYNLNIFDEIIIVTSENLLEKYKDRFRDYKNTKVILGGDTREASTFEGLKALNNNSDITMCHDGARPFVSEKVIIDSIDSAIKYDTGIAAVKSKDTIKVVKDKTIVFTPDRNLLYNIQTPQSFKTDVIKSAYERVFGKVKTTDDASFLEALGIETKIINGDYKNIKITTEEDLIYFKFLEEL